MSISELIQKPTISYAIQFISFNGGCGGFSSPYTLNTPLSNSSTQSNNISIPQGFWELGDCKVTYKGPSGYAFYYGSGCGFLTDTVGSYDFSLYINGAQDMTNLNAIYVGQTSSVSVGQITGTRIFNNGDYIQVAFNKGNDIVGNPVVNVFGMGFVLFRIG